MLMFVAAQKPILETINTLKMNTSGVDMLLEYRQRFFETRFFLGACAR